MTSYRVSGYKIHMIVNNIRSLTSNDRAVTTADDGAAASDDGASFLPPRTAPRRLERPRNFIVEHNPILVLVLSWFLVCLFVCLFVFNINLFVGCICCS